MPDNTQGSATLQKNKATTANQNGEPAKDDTTNMDRGDGRQPQQTDMQPNQTKIDQQSQAQQQQVHANDPGRQQPNTDPTNTSQETIKAPVDNNAHIAQFKTEQLDIMQRIRADLEELDSHLNTLI